MEVLLEEATWTFSRADERLEIRRHTADSPDIRLVVAVKGQSPRSYAFPDMMALTRFQNDMEQFLVHTGWSLLSFSPERRTGRDRRDWPRLTERRRWWTGPWTVPKRRLRDA